MTANGRDPHEYDICKFINVSFTVERMYDINFENRVPPDVLPLPSITGSPPPRPDPSTSFKKG